MNKSLTKFICEHRETFKAKLYPAFIFTEYLFEKDLDVSPLKGFESTTFVLEFPGENQIIKFEGALSKDGEACFGEYTEKKIRHFAELSLAKLDKDLTMKLMLYAHEIELRKKYKEKKRSEEFYKECLDLHAKLSEYKTKERFVSEAPCLDTLLLLSRVTLVNYRTINDEAFAIQNERKNIVYNGGLAFTLFYIQNCLNGEKEWLNMPVNSTIFEHDPAPIQREIVAATIASAATSEPCFRKVQELTQRIKKSMDLKKKGATPKEEKEELVKDCKTFWEGIGGDKRAIELQFRKIQRQKREFILGGEK